MSVLVACAPLTCKVKTRTEKYSFGSNCESKDQSCVDADTARLCDGDELASFECRGPEGCKELVDPKQVYCDRSAARPGDRCVSGSHGKSLHTCSEDGRAELACESGKWEKDKDCRHCVNKKSDTAIPHLPTFSIECEP